MKTQANPCTQKQEAKQRKGEGGGGGTSETAAQTESRKKQKKQPLIIIIHNNNLQNGSRWTGSSSKYIVYPITPTGNMTKRALFTL